MYCYPISNFRLKNLCCNYVATRFLTVKLKMKAAGGNYNKSSQCKDCGNYY